MRCKVASVGARPGEHLRRRPLVHAARSVASLVSVADPSRSHELVQLDRHVQQALALQRQGNSLQGVLRVPFQLHGASTHSQNQASSIRSGERSSSRQSHLAATICRR